MGKNKMLVGKTSFLKYTGSPLSVREKDVNNFKSKIFSAKYLDVEPEPDVYDIPKKTNLADFWKKIIRDETNMNTEIFNEYFKHQNQIHHIY